MQDSEGILKSDYQEVQDYLCVAGVALNCLLYVLFCRVDHDFRFSKHSQKESELCGLRVPIIDLGDYPEDYRGQEDLENLISRADLNNVQAFNCNC